MSLETYDEPSQLYLATGAEVSAFRPMFTGDVFTAVDVPGTPEPTLAIVVDHPCAFRIGGGGLADRVLMAVVRTRTETISASAWPTQHFAKSPLPDLGLEGYHIVHLNETGRVELAGLSLERRVACLSVFGINLLQQRLVMYLTRLEVETSKFYDAFGHIYEEADLLEEWSETLSDAQIPLDDAAARFEAFVRTPQTGGISLQAQFRDPQRRPAVRKACRAEAHRILVGGVATSNSQAEA